jgi:periplasmic copper chaperone A
MALLVAVSAVGCGGAGSGATTVDGVTIGDVWIRPTPPVTNVGAFYLTVRNGAPQPDRVVAASSPRCAEIEIHRTDMVDGVAAMNPAEAADLEVPAGGELRFDPTGLHVMCLGLDEPVVAGDRIDLTVRLEIAGDVTVEAVAENR